MLERVESISIENIKEKSEGSTENKRNRIEIVVTVVILLILLALRFSIMIAYVPSESMYPTINAGDRLVVNKLDKGFEYGDLVVFKAPEGYIDNGEIYVKRVVGLPGDTMLLSEGKVLRNNEVLEEDYILKGSKTLAVYQEQKREFIIPEGRLFLLGDNRENSSDSRYMGFIDYDLIEGKVIKIIFN